MYTARYKKSKEQCTGQCIQHVKKQGTEQYRTMYPARYKTKYSTLQENVYSTLQKYRTVYSTEQCTVKFKIQPIQFSKSNERHSIKSVQYSVLHCTALYIQMHSVHYNEEYTP